MSYSICLRCEDNVGYYQKYCGGCASDFKQDMDFWRNPRSVGIFDDEKKRKEELENDARIKLDIKAERDRRRAE